MTKHLSYRSDIDGLRAVAVLSVVLYHLDHRLAPGGYIGVDIFFVISGYLIGAILLKEFEAGTFSFAQFFERRIRRLFPAYFVMALATASVAWFVLAPEAYRQFGQSLFAATIFTSNILFYKEAGYFDRTSEEKPLLHTWSLAVEEQFYIIVPIVMAIIYFLVKDNARRAVVWFAALITVVSFALSVIALSWDASAVFYLFPFRAWELAIGVLLSTGIAPALKNARMANLTSALGALLIAIAIIFYTQSTPFPGAAALLPCIGSALILYAGEQHQPLVSRGLSIKPVVWVGLVSYSMYLWHWPVILLSEQGFLFERTLGSTIIIVVVIGIATYLSYRFVETPIRHARKSLPQKPLFMTAAMLSALLITIGAGLHVSHGVPARLSPEATKFAAASSDFRHHMTDCRDAENDRLPGIPNCLIGARTGEPTMLVWGDSHVLAFHDGIDTVMRENNVAGYYVQTTGCPPLIGLGKDEKSRANRQDEECRQTNEKMEEYLSGDRFSAFDKVLLVGRWAYYANGSGVGLDANTKIELVPFRDGLNADSQIDILTSAFEITVAALNKQNRIVYILEQPPEIAEFDPRRITVSLMRGAKKLTDFTNLTDVSIEEVEARQGEISAVFEDLESRQLITYLSTHEKFCNKNKCSVLTDGLPRMIDNNHVTVAGSLIAMSSFAPIFNDSTSDE